MNKKKQLVNRKHRKTKSRLKKLKDISLQSRNKKTPTIQKEVPEEIITNEVEEKKAVEKKSAVKKSTAKKSTAKKSTAKKSTTKKSTAKKK